MLKIKQYSCRSGSHGGLSDASPQALVYYISVVFAGLVMITCCRNCDAHRVPQPDNQIDTTTTAPPTTTTTTTVVPESLCHIFQDLRNLIAPETLIYITSKHYKYDPKFRHAMRFIHSAGFDEATEEIEDSEVIRHILMLMEDAGIDIVDIGSFGNILECLLLPLPYAAAAVVAEPALSGGVAAAAAAAISAGIEPMVYETSDEEYYVIEGRSLQTYATDIMNAIPRKKFRQLLAYKLSSNQEFAAFYRIVRNSAFQRYMLRALSSPELQYPLNILKRNFINIRQLLVTGFKIISWGPHELYTDRKLENN